MKYFKAPNVEQIVRAVGINNVPREEFECLKQFLTIYTNTLTVFLYETSFPEETLNPPQNNSDHLFTFIRISRTVS